VETKGMYPRRISKWDQQIRKNVMQKEGKTFEESEEEL
jgi:hypothetical protein